MPDAAELSPTVTRMSGGYRVGMVFRGTTSDGVETRSAVYDAQGIPLMVWRAPNPQACDVFQPVVAPSKVWVTSEDIPAGTASTVSGPYGALTTISSTLAFHQPHQGYVGDDELLVMAGIPADHVYVHDDAMGVTTPFGSATEEYMLPTLRGDAAFFTVLTGVAQAHVNVWTHSTQSMTELIAPGPGQTVLGAASDGTTLVWLVGDLPANMTPPFTFPNTWIWTSPHSTTPATLVPTKRRQAPPQGGGSPIANEGMMAFVTGDQTNALVHVFRLKDMWHWSFVPEYQDGAVVYVDADEVWVAGTTWLTRRRLDELGRGDSSPQPRPR